MKFLFGKFATDLLLLFFFLNVLWHVIESQSLTTSEQTSNSPTKSPSKEVKNATAVAQNETSITLQWEKVADASTYRLVYNDVSKNISDEKSPITYVVSPLISGTTYNFTLSVWNDGSFSSGYSFLASTAPEHVAKVNVVTQSENSITLKWDKVRNISTYILNYEGRSIKVDKPENESIQHVVSALTPGKTYRFILFTVFDGINSTEFSFSASTTPNDVDRVEIATQTETSITLEWNKTNSIPTYVLKYDGQEERLNKSEEGELVKHVVDSLSSGTNYSFTLVTVRESLNSTGFNFFAVTTPEKVDKVEAVTQNETSITLKWGRVGNISTYVLKYEDKQISVTENETRSVKYVVSALTAGIEYDFSVFAVFGGAESRGCQVSAVTAPQNVNNLKAVAQNETSVTLRWDKMENITMYILEYKDASINITSNKNAGATIQHVVSSLTAGTIYNFTLITVFKYAKSTGRSFSTPTVPSMVSSVRVAKRSINSIKLEWNIPNPSWSYHLGINASGESIYNDTSSYVASYTVSNLNPGTLYVFSVITQFSGLNSTVYKNITVTPINCANVNWHVTNSSIDGEVGGLFTKATANNKSQNHVSPEGGSVLFTGLYPGATYEISLEYETSFTTLLQCQHNLTIIPPILSARCEFWSSGYAARIVWNKPNGVWTSVEVNVTGERHLIDGNDDRLIVKGLQPAKKYSVSLASLSGMERKSEAFVFTCRTDDRGVIAGSVFAVLLFGLLVCGAVFVFLKRPDLLRGKKSLINGTKKLSAKRKVIPVANFPDHFNQLNMDDNRGFSLEYEELACVGTDQTRKVALLPENRAKNRFSNVLPYDWCRVKLETSSPNETLDYINANYMPGYLGKREYIAAQGPLPSTVNDFWRMIWEQRVKRIVMVTNCVEGGRAKCEQYWPDGGNPHSYGHLVVIGRSEQKEASWILREFRVKNENTSEERTIKHFHFTAWPDHGVPLDTQVLIQFRGLMRQHIKSDESKAPTVVHCSAGVGRTGTIITLDVVLQQLEKERVVGINAFVYKLRLNRPLMVQTEGQYVFLHQCVMDILRRSLTTDEPIYENSDVIYVNATALQELG